MGSTLYQVAVDAHDPGRLARFWAVVLGYDVLVEDAKKVVIGADEHAYPGIVFLRVPDEKAGKNRVHLDLAPDDHDPEVARILELGARRVDVGQGPDAMWTVLADPEGNEFCVLQPKTSLA